MGQPIKRDWTGTARPGEMRSRRSWNGGSDVATERTALKPNVYKDASARRVLRNCVRELTALPSSAAGDGIARIRGDALSESRALPQRVGQETALCASILCDLQAQGWRLYLPSHAIEVAPPAENGSVGERKAQIRAAH